METIDQIPEHKYNVVHFNERAERVIQFIEKSGSESFHVPYGNTIYYPANGNPYLVFNGTVDYSYALEDFLGVR